MRRSGTPIVGLIGLGRDVAKFLNGESAGARGEPGLGAAACDDRICAVAGSPPAKAIDTTTATMRVFNLLPATAWSG
jgi:hypothetical protein